MNKKYIIKFDNQMIEFKPLATFPLTLNLINQIIKQLNPRKFHFMWTAHHIEEKKYWVQSHLCLKDFQLYLQQHVQFNIPLQLYLQIHTDDSFNKIFM